MKGFVAVALGVSALSATAGCGSGPSELTAEHREAVRAAIASHAWIPPVNLELRAGIIVADFEVPADVLIPKRTLGEERLLAIREALLPFGFKDYRVNINGPPPGTGLTLRYGSARFLDAGGRLEWLPPPQ
jgi:hypothetical protein